MTVEFEQKILAVAKNYKPRYIVAKISPVGESLGICAGFNDVTLANECANKMGCFVIDTQSNQVTY